MAFNRVPPHSVLNLFKTVRLNTLCPTSSSVYPDLCYLEMIKAFCLIILLANISSLDYCLYLFFLLFVFAFRMFVFHLTNKMNSNSKKFSTNRFLIPVDFGVNLWWLDFNFQFKNFCLSFSSFLNTKFRYRLVSVVSVTAIESGPFGSVIVVCVVKPMEI